MPIFIETVKLDRLKNQDLKCYNYFGGKDGLGNCGVDCQWYLSGRYCPFNSKNWRDKNQLKDQKKNE